MSAPIGFLVALASTPGLTVLCHTCRAQHADSNATALYSVNIEPYRQTCHGCGQVIATPRTPAWCELFPAQTWVFTVNGPMGTMRVTYNGTFNQAATQCERDHGPYVDGGNALTAVHLRSTDGTERPMVLGDIA